MICTGRGYAVATGYREIIMCRPKTMIIQRWLCGAQLIHPGQRSTAGVPRSSTTSAQTGFQVPKCGRQPVYSLHGNL
jgi:hypothetical protein